tara:strand:+ start:223 stop:1644 length:1422 start_codon:yes stop_codon:yes gene_type:complete
MASITVISNLMEGLTRFDEKLHPIPAMADYWKYSASGKSLTFYLRDDVVWSDGMPVKAQDFEFSWKRMLDPATGSQYAYFLFDIENAFEFNSGKLKNSEEVGVKALSPKILQVKLKRPVAYFLSLVAFTATFPQRRDLIERYGDLWTDPQYLVVNGPFSLAERRFEYKLTLRANPHYYAGRPALDRVIFYIVEEANTALTLYESGEIDIVNLLPSAVPSYRGHPGFVAREQLTGNYYALNVRKAPFDNALVRQAFAYSIDRSRISQILPSGQLPTSSWIPKGMIGYNPEIGTRFNPKKARHLLAQAGYPKGLVLPEITAVYNSNINNRLVAEFLQGQWKKHLGVEIKLDSMEWKMFLNRLKVDPPQLYRGSWVADFPDPENFMNLFASASGNNRSHWSHSRYDWLVSKAAVEDQLDIRQIFYDEAQAILTEKEVAIIPLFSSMTNQLVQPYVTGYRPNAMNTINLRTIDLENR